MPKKSFSTTPSKKAENKEEAVLEQKKMSSTPKMASNEIDEIFAGKKRKKPEGKKTEKPNGDGNSKSKSMKKKDKKSKETKAERFNESSSQPRKRTADGFAIYTEEDLGINKSNAGSTPLCPFDCDCCF